MSFSSPRHGRGFLVEDVIDDLHFQEVVAGAERAALLRPAVEGVVGHAIGVGAVEAALGLGVVEVAARRQAAAEQVARPLAQQMRQLLVVELVAPGAADAGRHVAEQRLDQRSQLRLHVAIDTDWIVQGARRS